MALAQMTHEGYVITGDPQFPALKVIKPEGKGSVPKALRGMYTSFQAAKDHIDQTKPEEREANAPEANTTTRDEQVRERPDNGGIPA
jgi:hypothetical protein